MNRKVIFGILGGLVLLFLYEEIYAGFLVVAKPMIQFIGSRGILIAVAIMSFAYSYKISVALCQWIEDQTYGTRDYILKKCELLFIEIEPDKVTYILVFLTFGSFDSSIFCMIVPPQALDNIFNLSELLKSTS